MRKIIRQRGTGPRATSCRNTGRHHLGMPGRLRRNPQIPMPRRLDHLPTVLAHEEVEHLLKAVADLKLRTALITIYSAVLRISEAIRLTGRDIDSARMIICVRQGKGGQDRYTVLSKQLLGILRDYWHRTRPPHWLFPGRHPSRPVTKRALQLACRRAAAAAGLSKSVTV